MKTPRLRKTDALLAALVITCLAIGLLAGLWFAGGSSAPALPTQHISGLFIDLNGDGAIDYLFTGEAIFNVPPLSPTPPAAP
jgi:hypothetical protein